MLSVLSQFPSVPFRLVPSLTRPRCWGVKQRDKTTAITTRYVYEKRIIRNLSTNQSRRNNLNAGQKLAIASVSLRRYLCYPIISRNLFIFSQLQIKTIRHHYLNLCPSDRLIPSALRTASVAAPVSLSSYFCRLWMFRPPAHKLK